MGVEVRTIAPGELEEWGAAMFRGFHNQPQQGWAEFVRPDVYPVMRDFHDVAVTGWYGRPELATPDRAEEIAEAVADHVVREAREIWAALGPAGEGR